MYHESLTLKLLIHIVLVLHFTFDLFHRRAFPEI